MDKTQDKSHTNDVEDDAKVIAEAIARRKNLCKTNYLYSPNDIRHDRSKTFEERVNIIAYDTFKWW